MLSGSETSLFIVEHGNTSLGYIRLDKIDSSLGVSEISICVAMSEEGKGHSKKFLRDFVYSTSNHFCEHLLAVIHVDNHASKAIFGSVGFVQTKLKGNFETWERSS